MKNFRKILVFALVLFLSLTACQKDEIEKDYSVENKDLGIVLNTTKVENKYIEKDQLLIEEIPQMGIGLSYINSNGVDAFRELEDKPEAEVDPSLMGELLQNLQNYAILVRMPKSGSLNIQAYSLEDLFPNQELIKEDEENGDVVLYWRDLAPNLENFSSEDEKELQELIDNIPKLGKEVEVTDIPEGSDEISDFEAETFSGNTFSKSDFSDYDLTMINIWASWCGPCIEEMPDLQELSEVLPENMNMITINADADENEEASRAILEDTKATFETLIPEDVIEDEILSTLQAYPTTILVDKNGRIVETLMGVPRGNPLDEYLKIMEDTLESLE